MDSAPVAREEASLTGRRPRSRVTGPFLREPSDDREPRRGPDPRPFADCRTGRSSPGVPFLVLSPRARGRNPPGARRAGATGRGPPAPAADRVPGAQRDRLPVRPGGGGSRRGYQRFLRTAPGEPRDSPRRRPFEPQPRNDPRPGAGSPHRHDERQRPLPGEAGGDPRPAALHTRYPRRRSGPRCAPGPGAASGRGGARERSGRPPAGPPGGGTKPGVEAAPSPRAVHRLG